MSASVIPDVLRKRHLHVMGGRRLLDPLRLDQELHDLALELRVLLLALLEGLRRGHLRGALRARRRLLCGDTGLVAGRVGHRGLAAALRLPQRRRPQPLVELGLLDHRVADLGDGVRGDVASTPGDRGGAEPGDGGETRELDQTLHRGCVYLLLSKHV
jgi:hypothetical protein